MQSFPYKIKPFETDIFGTVSPAMMMRICTYATKLKADAEGLSSKDLFEKLGAVWMIARLKIEQERPVYEGDVELCVSSRCLVGGTYTRRVEVVFDGIAAAAAQIVFMLVKLEERSIVRPSMLEETWTGLPVPATLPALRKVSLPEGLSPAGSHVVSYAECDSNGHFSSPNYADIICESCGYWSGGQRIMRSIHIDYSAEYRPGETIALLAGEKEGVRYMRGIHPTGAIGFSAAWEMGEIGC